MESKKKINKWKINETNRLMWCHSDKKETFAKTSALIVHHKEHSHSFTKKKTKNKKKLKK